MFRTLESRKKNKITPTRILLILSAICIAIILLMYTVALLPQSYRIKDRLLEATFPMNLTAIGLMIAAALYYILFSRKKAAFSGTFLPKKDGIEINDRHIPLNSISKIRVIGNDIKGQFRGFVSKGTDNRLTFITDNGEETELAFEQTTDNQLKNYRDELAAWHEAGKLAEANYRNILNNTNYY